MAKMRVATGETPNLRSTLRAYSQTALARIRRIVPARPLPLAVVVSLIASPARSMTDTAVESLRRLSEEGTSAALPAATLVIQPVPTVTGAAVPTDEEMEARGYRPADPLPPELAARYAPAPLPANIPLKQTEDRGDYTISAGVLDTVSPALPFRHYQPKTAGKRALVIVFPILGGGGKAERHIAAMLAGRGHAVISVLRPDKPFRAEHDAARIEGLFQATISGARTLLDWAVRDQGADGRRVGAVGFSMGGIAAVTFLAAEPRARRSFIALAGADVGGMIQDSREPGILRYLRKRQERGVPKEAVVEDFRNNLLSDPLHTSRYVRPSGMIFVRALSDVSVPPTNSERLWKLLGKPRLALLPTGHYTTALFYWHLKSAIIRHFSKWEEA